MKKLKLPCPKCGMEVVFKKLEPIMNLVGHLDHYNYACPKCQTRAEFNKDYVREVWQERNPDKSIAIKF